MAQDKRMKLVFVHCPNRIYSVQQNYGARFLPAWAFTLAAHLPAALDIEVELVDLQIMAPDQVPAADVYLLSGINQDYETMVDVSADLRRRYPSARQLVGGPIAWSFEQAGTSDRLAMFDHICIGDGEEVLRDVLLAIAAGEQLPQKLVAPGRFDLSKAKPMHRGLLRTWASRYYAGVVYVSRGCPFLCEFCDIRVLEDNNWTRAKDPELVIEDVDFLVRQGVRKINLACDNFIGNLPWAELMVDRLIRWQQESGFSASFYTWVTTNLYRHPKLLAKMRRAGIEILFLGVESFDEGALLETAKVQNIVSIPDAVATIQSYGFIVVAGLIIGFDSDGEDFADAMLEGLEKSGLISGDPNWLTALPGTPLHRRMALSGRLRAPEATIGGRKYQTNIRYLLPTTALIAGFRTFVETYLSGEYQYGRFARLFEILARGNYIPSASKSFIDPLHFAKQSLSDAPAMAQHVKRLVRMLKTPDRAYYLIKGLRLAYTHRHVIEGWLGYFQFWVFTWTNAMFKYDGLDESEFDIESVASDFRVEQILPDQYAGTANTSAPTNKERALFRRTRAQLLRVIGRSAEA